MVYNTQNYCVFGVCPSSSILKTREHNVSETGSLYRKIRGTVIGTAVTSDDHVLKNLCSTHSDDSTDFFIIGFLYSLCMFWSANV
jgi:hypothetical protein